MEEKVEQHPLCINCRFYVEWRSRCKHPSGIVSVSYVDGVTTYRHAWENRRDTGSKVNDRCGVAGKYFAVKAPKKPIWKIWWERFINE